MRCGQRVCGPATDHRTALQSRSVASGVSVTLISLAAKFDGEFAKHRRLSRCMCCRLCYVFGAEAEGCAVTAGWTFAVCGGVFAAEDVGAASEPGAALRRGCAFSTPFAWRSVITKSSGLSEGKTGTFKFKNSATSRPKPMQLYQSVCQSGLLAFFCSTYATSLLYLASSSQTR
jgi:hypothetical protein